MVSPALPDPRRPDPISEGMARRSFLHALPWLGAPVLLPGWADEVVAQTAHEQSPAPGFRNEATRVEAVVGASHGNFDEVQRLVEEQPALARASWDWGFGDWETALGAASHMGRRNIADYLIAAGARPTIFSAAMMGQVDVVRAYLTLDPSLFSLHGPHGIPLLNHARAGQPESDSVVDYLLETFGDDERPFGVSGSAEIEGRYGGRYRFLDAPGVELVVGVRNGWLMVGAGDQPNSRVLEAGPDTFHPTGAPGVRLRFDVVGGVAESLTVTDGPVGARGVRTDSPRNP